MSGLGFVLAIYGVAAAIASFLGGAAFAAMAAILLKSSKDRFELARKAAFFPAKCAAWASLVFIVQATVNVSLLHRDAGLGDGFDIPLPDGYAITYIDLTDHGLVYNPRTQTDVSSPQAQFDAVSGVRFLQMQDHFLAGAGDTQFDKHFEQQGAPVDSYFVIDTDTNRREDFPSKERLQQWATAHDFNLKLEPISNFYQRYRWTWFDGLALAALLIPPGVGLLLLAGTIFRARRTGLGQPMLGAA